MVGLRDVAEAMHGVLRGDVAVEDGAARLGVSAERLAIYRDFVRGHVTGVLDKNYSVVKSMLPDDLWRELSEGYYRAHPARSWELNDAVREFPEYLLERAEAGLEGIEPYHVALASLEWAEFAAYVNPARMPSRARLARPVLNPTLSVMELPVPVISMRVAANRGETVAARDRPTPEEGPETVLVFRDPDDGASCFYRADDDLLFAIKIAYEGLDPEAVARQLGLPVDSALESWSRAIRIGLVLVPSQA